MPSHELLQPDNQEIFVKSEEEYCRAHHIELRRLANGITIVALTRLVSDHSEASIDFSFPHGSYFDPRGKEGLHHLLEHLLITPRLREKADAAETSLNAATHPLEVNVACEGFVVTGSKTFGLEAFLPTLCQGLKNPLKNLREETVEMEEKVILEEIAQYQGSHDWHSNRFVYEKTYDPDNPLRVFGTGTEESLAKITPLDIQRLGEKLLTSHSLTVSVLGEGKKEISKRLATQLENLLGNFPNTARKIPIDWSLTEKMTPNFVPGEVYLKDTGLNNNLATLSLLWCLTTEPFSPSSLALRKIVGLIQKRWFRLIREKSLSYSPEIVLIGSDQRHPIINTNFLTSAETLKNLRKEILKEVAKSAQAAIENISEKEMEEVIKKERLLSSQIPPAVDSQLAWILYGLKRYGKIISLEKIRERFRQITPSHIKTWQEKLLATKPAFVIVGDLSQK